MRHFLLPIVLFSLSCRSDKGVMAYNSTPEAMITSHSDGDGLIEGAQTVFRGVVSDANHSASELLATWYIGSDVLCPEQIPESDGTLQCEGTLLAAERDLSLEVRDPNNATGTDRIELNIIPSAVPSAEIIAPQSGQRYYRDQPILFEGLVSDAEDAAEVLVCSWESSLDGPLSEMGCQPDENGLLSEYALLSEGEHNIDLIVIDSSEKSGTDSVLIEVGPPNSPPLCDIVSPSSSTVVTTGSLVEFQALVSDVDEPANALTVQWSSDKDGDLGSSSPSSSGEVTFLTSALSANPHTVTLTVTDELDAVCAISTTLIVSSPPTVSITAPLDGDIVDEGSAISFSAELGDAEDAPETLLVDWRIDGNSLSSQGADSTGVAQWSISTLTFGNHTLELEVTDSTGLSASDQLSFTVNGIPSAPLVAISPAPAQTADALQALISAPSIDPEGQNISYSYLWLKNGLTQNTLNTDTVPASNTSKGEIWTVEMTPSDGQAFGPTATASLTIENTPPEIVSLAFSPASLTAQDTAVQCIATSTDVDGDSVSSQYSWTLDGQGLSESSDTLSGPFDYGASIVCTAVPHDGDDNGADLSASITVGNTPPEVISLVLSPNVVYTDDLIAASAVLSDIDGQSVSATYEWHVIDALTGVDSIVQQGSSSTLDGTLFFDRGDEVYVTVAPNDGLIDGAPFDSASIVVANSAPQSASLTMTPNPAIEGIDDLLCSVNSPAADADGDTLTYTYTWTDPAGSVIQQVSSSALSDLLSGTATSIGTWTCSVVADDGTDFGASSSASTLVESACPSDGDGSDSSCPAEDCGKILADGYSFGDGLYWIDPQGSGSPYEVYCLMDSAYDGGGWTLVMTSSDDAQDTWTWTNRLLMTTNLATVGNVLDRERDFKSQALNEVGMSDLLFVHAPSGVWAGYNDVDSGIADFGVFVDSFGGPNCYAHGEGFALSTGTLTLGGNLCSTELFISPQDRDGGACPGNGDSAFGPAWSANKGAAGCLFDDPGISGGLGPNGAPQHHNGEYVEPSGSIVGVGFGLALSLNTGPVGGGDNYMQVFVRRDYGDADNDGFEQWEDCDDQDSAVAAFGSGASANCAAESCLSILNSGLSTGDGQYWLDPAEQGPFEAFCDMTTDGGGWTLAQSINSISASQYDSAEILDTQSSFGSSVDDNMISPAFYRLHFTESYLIDELIGIPVYSDTPITESPVGDVIDSMQNQTYGHIALWQLGTRSSLIVRDSYTTDGLYSNGDIRIQFAINSVDTVDLAHSVSTVYTASQNGGSESILVLDSDYGFAGGRIYAQPLYTIASVGIDNRYWLYLR